MSVTVRQKRKGPGKPWHVFVHEDGIIRSRKVGTKREANAVAAKLRKQLRSGHLGLAEQAESTCPKFGEYARNYMDTYVATVLKPTTREGYEYIYKQHLAPAWASKRLDQITREAVKALLTKARTEKDGKTRKKPLAAGSLRNIRNLISGIFTQAVEDGHITVNPAQRLGKFLPKDRDRKAHIRPLNRDKVKTVLATAAEMYPEYYPVFLCGFRTGMRIGENLGLAWEDVDFEGKSITVRRSWSHYRFSTPKTHKSRLVDMSDQLARTLLAHRTGLLRRFRGNLPRVAVPAGMAEGETIELLFPYHTGKQIDASWFRRIPWRKVFEKADIPEIRIHDMRHTFASLLLQQGESLHYVKEQLGHASIQTTVDVYGHLAPGSNRNAVNKLDDDETPPLRLASAAS